MRLATPVTEIPLGVECAWPIRVDACHAGPTLRRRRLAEAWRRLMSALGSPRRRGWAG